MQAVRIPCGGNDDPQEPFSLECDLLALRDAIKNMPECRLVIIDPISAYMGGSDSHRNTDVRAVLAPLAALAAEYRIAVLAVTHLNKNAGTNVLYRATGSLAFVAAARAVLLVVRDSENPNRRLMLSAKNNIARDGTGLAYSIEPNGDGMGVVAWEPDPVTIRADDALGACVPDYHRGAALDEAIAWLRDQLCDGPRPAKTVKEAAESDGIKSRTLDRAKAELGVEATRDGFGGPWVWKLPDSRSAPNATVVRQQKDVAHYDNSGALCDGDSPSPIPSKCPSIPLGWAPASWADRLDRLATACEAINPALAAEHRSDAAAIREKLNNPKTG